ncbi:unnamed protein product, partial [Vitis vinifera]
MLMLISILMSFATTLHSPQPLLKDQTPLFALRVGSLAARPSLVAYRRGSFRTLTIGDGLVIGAKSGRIGSFRCFSALTPELKTTLDKVVTSNKVVLFMKGTKEFPQCGFSNTVVQILNSLNVPFETINILENEILRQGLKEYSNWPTFPQLYIEGEFFGGCDITVDAYNSGQLQEQLEKAMCS